MYRERFSEKLILDLFAHFPVVVVVGARQTGKTTEIEKCFKDKLSSFTFDPFQDLEGARKDPDFFLESHPAPLFLDEIQYAPELMSSIKRKVDKVGKPGMYILSGSQNLSVIKGIAESLAGRAAVLHLLPLGYCEWNGKASNASFPERLDI